MNSSAPIGIFDSGTGGLTVAKAVRAAIPDESIIYFGDIAHLPYGDKSTAAIQAYSIRIADFLLQRKCKVILIACNSASSAAYELVREYVGKKAQVFDVINPTIDYLREHYQRTNVGLIGTKQTVTTGVYAKKVDELRKEISLSSLATPLLVPMIEEELVNNDISKGIIHQYLADPALEGITSLILACTHYPIIKSEIEQYFREKSQQVEVIDSATVVAEALKSFLAYHQLDNKSNKNGDHFYVSDFTPAFESMTKLFFGEQVHLEQYPLWE
ncbi:MAG: glutamate racemase [Cyclobacteriaceae bacterium]|nr:glutamate racemase [Cyclobacteriaceae bacterium HetDA_MAG_MS6]